MMFKSIFYGAFMLALVCLSTIRSENLNIEEEEDVLVLTDDNFDQAVENHNVLLVEFYAPWCGHCKSLAPEYAKAAKALKTNDPPIRLAKLDATAHNKVASKYEVQGFPTLKVFKGDVESSSDYDGGRTADEIEKWMIKKSGPSVSMIETQEELDVLTKENDVVVIALVSSVESEEKQVMERVADQDDVSVYVATTNAALVGDKTAPFVQLLKSFDDGNVDFEGEWEQDAVASFVQANNMPLVMVFSQEKASQIFGGSIDTHVLLFTDESKDYQDAFQENAKKAAKETKGKLLHIMIPASEDRILDYFGLSESDLPAVMLVNMAGGMKKYQFASKSDDLKDSLSTTFSDDLIQFEKDYFDNKLKATLKSADPADDSDEAVKIIVGKDFQERVVDSDQDVLLEFYAPWCGHCKNLTPKYEELAEKFADVSSIVIAKIDGTENEVDHPGVNVQGFPTLIFFPSKKKMDPIPYDGARDVAGMTAFLKKNAQKFDLEGETHGVSHDEL